MELEPRTTAPAHATGAVEFISLDDVADDATFRLRPPGDVASLAASIGRLGHLVPVELRLLPGLGPDDPPRYQVVAGFRRVAALRLLARERVLARVHEALDDDDAWGIALAQALLGEPLRGPELEALRARIAEIRVAAWAGDLVDEALVRAPVEPDQREAFLAFLAGAPAPAPASPAEGEDMDALGAGEEAEGEEELEGEEEAQAEGEEEPQAEGGEEPQAEGEEGGDAPEDSGPVEVTPEELAEDLAQRLSDVVQDLAVAFESWADLPREGRRTILEQARYVAELYPHLRGGGR
jgi:ParB-like chromosome segregation protein Spo0J